MGRFPKRRYFERAQSPRRRCTDQTSLVFKLHRETFRDHRRSEASKNLSQK